MKDNSIYPDRNSPCKNCEDRELGCHSTCERYIAYTDARAKERKARQTESLQGMYFRDKTTRFINHVKHHKDKNLYR